MSLAADKIALVAIRVASHVRRKVPRSSNRMLDPKTGKTDWLKDQSAIPYTKFVLAMSRVKLSGSSQNEIKTITKEKHHLVFTNKVASHSGVRDLKDVVLEFLNTGRVEGRPVDLGYKPDLNAEQQYSQKFGAALAEYLNSRGFRNQRQERFTAEKVMDQVTNALLAHDRTMRQIKSSGDKSPPFPLNYIAASARNAFRFQLGNCEECACAAFALLLNFSNSDGTPLVAVGDPSKVRVEMVYGKSGGDAHYFLILNRSGSKDILEDLGHWIDNPSVIACDPWITNEGAGGRITSTSEGIQELRAFLKPSTDTTAESLQVRATGYLGMNGGLKGAESFRLEDSSPIYGTG